MWFDKQPWKALYLIYEALTILLIRIPIWTILNIPRFMRPRRSWNLSRAVFVKTMRYLSVVEENTGPLGNLSPSDHRAILSGKGVLALWIPPAPESLVVGKLKQWAEHADVAPIRIPGYWIHKAGTDIQMGARAQPGEKVILALHGGAYIRLSAHPTDLSTAIALGLLKHVDGVNRVFAPEFRLSSAEPFEAANPFPAALLDALTGYLYLVKSLGFSPSDVILEGNSSGGNIACALTRYLTEYRGIFELPAPPGALLLLSPWADLSDSHNEIPGGSATTFVEFDILGRTTETLKYPVRAFTGPHGLEEAQINPYISPASLHPNLVVDFKKFPRTFIVAGGVEVLVDQIRTLRDRMVKDMSEGNGVSEGDGKVRYLEPPDAIHDYLSFSWHEPEVTDTLKAIAEWIALS